MAGKSRQKKQPPTFEFEFQGKKYVIHGRYECQPATIFLTDGAILQVHVWKISSAPYEPLPDRIEPFDPLCQSAAELAAAAGGFVAELVQEATKPAE